MKRDDAIARRVQTYLDDVAAHLDLPDPEKAEVLRNVKDHIYESLQRGPGGQATMDDLETVLAGMDAPASYGDRPRSSARRWLVPVAAASGLILLLAVVFGAQALLPGAAPEADHDRPPRVAATVPAQGVTGVDPALAQLRVTFDKDMLTNRMWAWCYEDPATFPEIEPDSVQYVDSRTCVVSVRLEPGRTYVVWFNTENHDAFRDRYNNPAVPYRLEFSTRAEPGGGGERG